MPTLNDEAWAQIRYAYEHTDRPVEDICIEYGTTSTTLRDRMRRWRWTRRRPPIPRDGPPALHPPLEREERRALNDVKCEPGRGEFQALIDHPTPPTEGEGAPADAAAIVPRLQGAVGRVLPAIEAIIARLAAGPYHPREMEQAGRALSSLTRTLRELNALLAQQQARAAEDDDDARDIDEIRNKLAQRIHALVDAERGKEEEAKQGET